MPREVNTMFEITGPAREKIQEIVHGEKNPSPIRIMMAGGCIGPHLGMLFDSVRPNDQVFDVEGIQYAVDKELLFRFQPITVDYRRDSSGERFSITSPRHDADP